MKKSIIFAFTIVLLTMQTALALGNYGYYDGKRYERVHCILTGPADCVAGGGRHFVGNDIYFGNRMHWRYVGDAGSEVASDAGHAASSSSIAVNKIIRQTVFVQARPRTEQRRPAPIAPAVDQPTPSQPFYESIPNVGRLHSGSADIFLNVWEIEGYLSEVKGQSFGINPSATWGETYDLTLTLPLHVISPKGGDTVFGTGLDGAFKYPFTGTMENFIVGAHLYGMGFFGGDDTAVTFGGGPFVGYSYRFHPDWIVSGGLLLEITKPNEGDVLIEVVPAVNMGYNLSEAVALNGYLINYKNFDSDSVDDLYSDIGLDVAWVRGAWSFSSGLKTAVGAKNVKSTEVYIGSNWVF